MNNQRQHQQNSSSKNQTKVTKFEELFVGPLIKNQLVRQMLKIPVDVISTKQLKPISGVELCKHLINFLREKELWAKKVHFLFWREDLLEIINRGFLSQKLIKIKSGDFLIVKNIKNKH